MLHKVNILIIILLSNLILTQGFLQNISSFLPMESLSMLPMLTQNIDITSILKKQITKGQQDLTVNPNYRQGTGRQNFLTRYSEYINLQKYQNQQEENRRSNLLMSILKAQQNIKNNPVLAEAGGSLSGLMTGRGDNGKEGNGLSDLLSGLGN